MFFQNRPVKVKIDKIESSQSEVPAMMPLHSNQIRGRCETGNARVLPPKILEPRRRQFCVPDRVLDIAMAQLSLHRPSIVALVGKRIATGVAQHVRVSLQPESSLHTSTLDHSRKTSRRERRL